MNLKEYFESIDIKEIKSFIENQIAEDLYIEFKTANYPKELKYDKINFSKSLSGFANSSGGILIWGVSAKENNSSPDVANKLKPIPNLIEFENYLKKNEGNAIVPLIKEVEYRRVFEDNNSGYLLVYVPKSDRSPHMALFADKRYYKRSGDSFYPCEHFDIVDMFNRNTIPELSVDLINEKFYIKRGNYGEYPQYEGIICIRNIGQTSAKHIIVTLSIKRPFNISNYGIDGNGNRVMRIIRVTASPLKYLGGSELVLHPETFHEIDKITLNEISDNRSEIDDLIIDYSIVAEGMRVTKGVIRRKKEDIINLK